MSRVGQQNGLPGDPTGGANVIFIETNLEFSFLEFMEKTHSQWVNGLLELKFAYLYDFRVKVTQINYVSRNQLHNTANSCRILNFGLSWPG